MKVVVAIDSLKGSLNSIEAGDATKDGILSVYKDADVKVIPLADGGEGTVDALIEGMNGRKEFVVVTGPLGESIEASYGILEENHTAIIEMAQASGLPMVPIELRNPMHTTTYGVGELIKDAIEKGCRRFIVGIGGSSTNDAGVGMLQALGFEFYDSEDNLVSIGGQVLKKIVKIRTDKKLKELEDCNFEIACDVNNPLYGINGAAHIYGPQKGATPEIIEELDQGLMNFAKVVNEELANIPGTGAAGGLGYGFLGFLNAELKPGIDIIMKEVNLEKHLMEADFVITGEGRLDYQTAMGKAPIGVAKLAKKHQVKVIGLAGAVNHDANACNDEGIDAYFSIQLSPRSLEEAMEKEVARNNMKNTVIQLFKLVKAMK